MHRVLRNGCSRPVVGCLTKAFMVWATMVGSAVLALLVAIIFYQISYQNHIYLGVRVMGVDVGGMTRLQAQTALVPQVDSYLGFPITLQHGDQQWTLTAQQAGATLDILRMVEQAYAVGRQGSLLVNLRGQWQAYLGEVDISPIIRYDPAAADAWLIQLAQAINRPARAARLIIQPDLRIEALPGQDGLELDLDAARTLIQQHVMARDVVPFPLPVRTTPAIVSLVEPARQQAEALLSAPLVLSLSGSSLVGTWTLSPAQLADMLLISETVGPDGVGRISLLPDRDKWSAYLEQLAKEVERPAVDARFEIDPASGQLTVLQPSQPAIQLDTTAALEAVAELVAHPRHQLELPATVVPPAVPMERAAEMGFSAVVAEATSYYQGSPPERVHNIGVAASKFHGLVLPPGAVFSFNQYLGPLTTENGFVEGKIIWGDRTEMGIGGGVCQVSTTIFRAAYWGGFEILERWAHAYRVGWYEIGSGPGLDATVYAPDLDLKFRNDTDHYLLIQAYNDPQAAALTFRFYGTPTGRQVISEGPFEENVRPAPEPKYEDDASLPRGQTKQVEWAKDGVDITVRRTVTQGGSVIHQDVFVSQYQPWAARFLRGTGNPP